MISNSELRQDLVSGDWIVVAPSRRKRPRDTAAALPARVRIPREKCPFEDPQGNGNGEPLAVYPLRKNWQIQLIRNKYPVLAAHTEICPVALRRGPYAIIPGRGYHELFITRDHDNNFPKLTPRDAVGLFNAFQNRYRALAKDKCLSYILIFHNWGPMAGASVYHPHYQLIAIPVIPPDVEHSLDGSKRYFKKHRRCVHCTMIAWEKKEKKRVVYENKKAIVVAPFVSRNSFELRVFPKNHTPYFEDTSPRDMELMVDAVQRSLARIEKKLNDPDYNFFIHTAPVANKSRFSHYHWHIEILPKTNIWAGFELGTGIEIVGVDPDQAARLLRNTRPRLARLA
ncbi:DUF4921 family protein [Candidatus Wolfebacteria bacterium]|nr:DUF4921 family protein [Candidatus Wolfebacteria bacterium]